MDYQSQLTTLLAHSLTLSFSSEQNTHLTTLLQDPLSFQTLLNIVFQSDGDLSRAALLQVNNKISSHMRDPSILEFLTNSFFSLVF